MNYGRIKTTDIANGEGVRVSLFVSGCTHRCHGCFNPETWDFDYGVPFTRKTVELILDSLNRPYIAGLTILGGEPLEVCNAKELVPLLRDVRKKLPKKDIWIYSGYTLEELLARKGEGLETTISLLCLADVLVDGVYEEDKKDISLAFCGSSNQRILDIRKSLDTGTPINYILDSGHEIF